MVWTVLARGYREGAQDQRDKRQVLSPQSLMEAKGAEVEQDSGEHPGMVSGQCPHQVGQAMRELGLGE